MENVNAKNPAFPVDGENWNCGSLTKREYFSGLALQAMLSNPANNSNQTFGVNGGTELGFLPCEHIVKTSLLYADELLKQLSND